MKRLSTIVFLCGMVFVANVFAMSEAEKEIYRKELKRSPGELETVLALDEDGVWNWVSGYDLSLAKRKALKICKKASSKPKTCKIVDVNGNSDFIKQKGSVGWAEGEAYRTGEGVEKNYKEAVKWYKQVADEDPLANFWIGHIYETGGYGITKDYGEAFKWYMKGAETGEPVSQYVVGQFYQYGLGVPANKNTAASWYRKSVEQGDYNAQSALAEFYEKGIGVTQDIDKAIELYRLSAKQGETKAKDALKRLNVKVSPKSSTSNTSGSSDR